MKYILISAVAASLFLLGCGNETTEQAQTQTEEVSHEGHDHAEADYSIELIDGQKWKVDEDMMVFIRNMEQDASAFQVDEGYPVLAGKLQQNLDLLTSNCTMTGQAHDELHKWLLPYIDLVQELSKAESEAQAAEGFQNVQASFVTFNQYFD